MTNNESIEHFKNNKYNLIKENKMKCIMCRKKACISITTYIKYNVGVITKHFCKKNSLKLQGEIINDKQRRY